MVKMMESINFNDASPNVDTHVVAPLGRSSALSKQGKREDNGSDSVAGEEISPGRLRVSSEAPDSRISVCYTQLSVTH